MRHGEGWQPAAEGGDTVGEGRTHNAVTAGCPVGGINAGDYYYLFPPVGPPDSDETVADDDLERIAERMIEGSDPKAGNDGIPAGYTYFGQFVVHDLTKSRSVSVGSCSGVRRAENLNTPRLDLDSLYGNGPSHDPHLYQRSDGEDEDRYLFLLGRTGLPKDVPEEEFVPTSRDLPRIDLQSRGIFHQRDVCFDPLVGDSRNDDNLVLSQLTVLFLEVHNTVATALKQSGKSNRESFETARAFVVASYHKIILHDYLARLLTKEFADDLTSAAPELLNTENCGSGIPLEFVFGAARVGHAMIRRGYKVNELLVETKDATIGDLLNFSSFAKLYPTSSGRPKLPLPEDWVVWWRHFFDVDCATQPQLARRISPFWPGTLKKKNHRLFDRSLMYRDLSRSGQYEVLSGQACARALRARLGDRFQVPVLDPEEIRPRDTFPSMGDLPGPLTELDAVIQGAPNFKTSTPLAFYLVQEAVHHGCGGRRLGPLGSYIFATTIWSALLKSSLPSGVAGFSALHQARKKKGVCSMPAFIRVRSMTDHKQVEEVIHQTLC